MERRVFLKSLSLGLISGLSMVDLWGNIENKQDKQHKILLAIYKEVQELGPREKEDFIKREFHFNLDGRWDNREEHIVVLCHKEGSGDKMILQVTYFEEKVSHPTSRLSLTTEEISSLIDGDLIKIAKTTISCEERDKLLPEILLGIRKEKKLLRSLKIDHSEPLSRLR